MNTILGILTVLTVIALLFASLVYAGKRQRARLANIAEGTHEESIFMLTDGAITARHLLYKSGSDASHIAASGATDLALGTVDDLAAAAEEGVTLNFLGKGSKTKRMVANAAITQWARVYQAAGGKVAPSGTRYRGICVNAPSGDGEIAEVIDTPPAAGISGFTIIAAGLRTWAGGVATTENFAVVGVLSTDLVLVSWNVVAGTITAIKAAPTADLLTITTSANQANGDKYSYTVLRAE